MHYWRPSDKTNPAYVEVHPYAGSVSALCVNMMQRLRSTEHTMVCDNYFTTPKCFRALREAGFHAVGTVKQRSGIPKSAMWPKNDSRRPSGAARASRSTDRILVLQEWQDSGLVRVLSTGACAFPPLQL